MIISASCLIVISLLSACSILEKEENPQMDLTSQAIKKPLPPEKTTELMEKVGINWFYGQGLGETALTVGTIFAFPPYAIYVVGNGALQLAGYKPLHVTDALPGDAKEGWNTVYDTVTGAPGHLTAAVGGREYREKDVIDQDYKNFLSEAYPYDSEEQKGQQIDQAAPVLASTALGAPQAGGELSLR